MPALTPDEARKRTGWNDTPFQKDEERAAEMRSGVKRTLTRCYATPSAAIRAEKLTRLIARWRKEAAKAEANSIDTGLKWINVQALCIRKCADELERLLNL